MGFTRQLVFKILFQIGFFTNVDHQSNRDQLKAFYFVTFTHFLIEMAYFKKSGKVGIIPFFTNFVSALESWCLEYIKLGEKIECDIVRNHFRISMCPRDFFTTDTQLLGTNSCLLCLRLIRNHMLLRFVTLPNMGANTLKKVFNSDKRSQKIIQHNQNWIPVHSEADKKRLFQALRPKEIIV